MVSVRSIAIVIIVIIIAIFITIFAPSNGSFFNNDIFKGLIGFNESLDDELRLKQIDDDILSLKDKDWVNFPGRKNDKLQIYPFCVLGTTNEQNIKKCPHVWSLINSMYGIRSAMIIKLKGKSITEDMNGLRRFSNRYIRCILPIYSPMNDINQCGISCAGKTKKIIANEWIIFDASKKHHYYNKREQCCIMILIDLIRPYNIPQGNSQKTLNSDEYIDLIKSQCSNLKSGMSQD